MAQDLGRQVKYGVGKETTAGTAVAASYWINQLSFELNPTNEVINNESAWGRVERTNSATIARKWAEGSLEAKLTAETGGLILLGAFGSVSSAANADGSGLVYDHTFTVNQDITGQSLTFVRKDSISTKAYALGRIGQWELSMELDDYVKITADVMAKAGATTTATPSYAEESEFVAKHTYVKTAANLAGLSGASNISTVQSFTVRSNPNLEADKAAGSAAPYGFSSRGFDLEFEMECRYTDATYEDAYNNGTELALEVGAVNTDVTIGTGENPGLVIQAPKMTINEWEKTGDLDDPLAQTISGVLHFDSTSSKAISAVLTNLTASY